MRHTDSLAPPSKHLAIKQRFGLVVVVAATMMVALMPSAASAATREIRFDVLLGHSYLYGSASDSTTLQLRWKDAAGHLKAEADVPVSAYGSWSFYASAGITAAVGDRLIATDGVTTRKFVVPELTAVANRVKNVFKGTGPIGSYVRLECTYPGEPVPDIACDARRLAVNDEGHWFYRPGWNIEGGDGIQLSWKSPHGDRVGFGAQAPYLVVTLGSARVSGEARHNSAPSVQLRDAVSGNLLGSWSSTIGLDQRFAGRLRDGAGALVVVAPGQYVSSSIASDAAFTVPEIDAIADVASDTVSGRCSDTGRAEHKVWIRILRNGIRRGFAATGTDAAGYFSEDMSQAFPDESVIKHGDDVLVSCVQKNRDFVQKWFAVP
jgi:hypothetical protein